MDERSSSFGYWLRRRRKALDLTQEALARAVACSRFTIRKIEADERRPSRRLAERLAERLAIPQEERPAFMAAARALRAAARLEVEHEPLAQELERQEPAEGSRLVGRAEEQTLLDGLLDQLAGGAGHLVLIEGEPGIGKSRLMSVLAHGARARGIPTLATNCYEIERAIPYQAVIELVTRALEATPAATLRSLPPVTLAELAALVPALEQRIAVPVLSADFPEARQARLLAAIAQLFTAFAGSRPLLILVDDIQWLDSASAQCVHYLARGSSSQPVLVACAYRDEELDGRNTLAELVSSLRQEPQARHLRLARLPLAATRELVAGVVDHQLTERLQRETDGNPFFLVSMLQALTEGEISPDRAGELPLPEALRTAVRARLAHVPAEVKPVLDMAAVLGRRFDFERLFAVLKEPEEKLLGALDTLVRRRLLREDAEGHYDFSHDKVREVAYGEVGGARRRLLHRAVAEALERRGEGEPHERDAQLAEHYERGHVWSKAVRHMALAAERSGKLFALRDALHWFDRAVALAAAHPEALPQPALLELHEARGRARADAGLTAGAVEDIRLVIDAARGRGDRVKARDALITLGMTYRRADDHARAIACLTEARENCRTLGDDRGAASTLYHLGTVAWSSGRNREAIAYHDEAVELCERLALEDLVAVQAYHGRGEAHFSSLEPAAAIRCYRRSNELARGLGDKSYEAENLMMIGYANLGCMGLGDYQNARASFEAALEIAQRADLQWHMGPTVLGLDHVRGCLGNYGEAWTGLVRTLRWLESLKLARYQLIAHTWLGYVLLDVGENERAAQHSARALEIADAAGIAFWRGRLQANLAIARVRLGDLDGGAEIARAARRARENDERHEVLHCLEALAEIALARGEVERCSSVAAEWLQLAQASDLREAAARARRWQGEALAVQGDRNAAVEQLRMAAASAEEIGRVRLAWEAEDALARLDGGDHRARADALAARMAVSIEGSELRMQQPPAGGIARTASRTAAHRSAAARARRPATQHRPRR